MIGQTVSHYSVLDKLGEGGMGSVYKARDNELGRLVALKVLRQELLLSEDHRRRVRNEARSASMLNHPNIVTIHDIIHVNDLDCIVMEYIEGRQLSSLIPADGLTLAQLLDYAIPIASALGAAHAAGIVHRDLKPQNILVTGAGTPKIVDFGLAKLAAPESIATEAKTATAPVLEATGRHVIVGTVAYMSPEQVEGKPVNARSDVFSFGIVLYEMACGKRPFAGESTIATMGAILHATPDTGQLPSALRPIVCRALEKNPAARYASATELLHDLRRIGAQAAKPRWPVWVAASVVVALLAVGGFWYRGGSRAQQDRERIPEVQRLFSEGKQLAALDLLAEVEKATPDDPRVPNLRADIVRSVDVTTDPPGANVYFREYTEADNEWRYLGKSPIRAAKIPFGNIRWKLESEGRPTTYAVSNSPGQVAFAFVLLRKGGTPPGMVDVLPGTVSLNSSRFQERSPVKLEQFQVDRFETTNRQFKEFVDAGGYRKRDFWKHPFRKGSRTLSWEEATRELVDATGRPGPSAWEAGSYAAGKDEFPVSGVSWYEAAAYAEFAGKNLPSVHHWYRTAAVVESAAVAGWSNLGGSGPARVGQFKGEGPFGTFDVAGNVKEWCWNETGDGLRFILGGSWKEATYQFNEPDALSPFDRSDDNGFRCVRYPGALDPSVTQPLSRVFRDYTKEKPASDAEFQAYRNHYAFDRQDLNPAVESEDDHPHWKRQRIVITTGYGSERLPIYLLLPKVGKPPFQSVLLYPGTNVQTLGDSRTRLATAPVEYLVRSGRAAVLPILFGTYERPDVDLFPNLSRVKKRESAVRRYQDIVRTLDYLETRSDLDRERIAYLGVSWGSAQASPVLAMEPRFKTAILQIGGLPLMSFMPEADPIHFAPRVRLPVLMINGRYDFTFPLETSQKPLFQTLGTPEKDKRLVLFDTGHEVGSNRTGVMREVLGWLDRYMGPVYQSVP